MVWFTFIDLVPLIIIIREHYPEKFGKMIKPS